MAPVAAMAVHETEEDLLVLVRPQIHSHPLQVFLFEACRPGDYNLGVIAHDFQARGRVGAAANEEAGPGMTNFERNGRECSCRLIPTTFIGADPVLPLMLAAHIVAAR